MAMNRSTDRGHGSPGTGRRRRHAPPDRGEGWTAAFVLLLLLTAPALVAAQPAAPAPPAVAEPGTETEEGAAAEEPVGTFSEEVSVSWVLVPVLVTSGEGYETRLSRDDFHLYVDDDPVPIADFEAGAWAPISLVFLQDLSGSMANADKLTGSRRALAHVLARARPFDEFALASFAGELTQVEVPFTREEQVLAEAMERWEAYGTTALHDAVAWIPEITAEGRYPKRAVLLLSDGVDNASAIEPERARDIVRRAQLPVYVIGLGRNGHAAVPSRQDNTYARLLQELARATGGRYFPVRPGGEVTDAALALLEDLRRQYVLAFPTAPGEPEYRRIRVEVSTGDAVTVYHRKGYRGGPPA